MREPVSFFIASYRFLSVFMVSCFAAHLSYSQQFFANDGNPYMDIFYGFLLQPNPAANAEINFGLNGKAMNDHNITNAATGFLFSSEPVMATPGTIIIPGLFQTIVLRPENGVEDDLKTITFDVNTEALLYKFAEIIETEPEDVNNFSLYKFIDNWYGVRYKWGGNSSKGIDCSAFSQKLYDSIYKVSLLRTSRQQHRSCDPIKKYEDAVEGDLIFFRIRRFRISHVGIYLANGHFVHATRSKGVRISSVNEKYWHRRYAGCGRIEREEKEAAESDFLQ